MFFSTLFHRSKNPKNPASIERGKCCAFTGHRPEKLYGKEAYVISALRKEIEDAIADGYTIFVTGCSRGVDLWAADIILEMRRSNSDIKLVCAIPFPEFDARWSIDWKKHFRLVKKNADYIHVVEQAYHPGVYQKRNEYMCDHASRIIAVCDGKPSGTQNTIDYARLQNLPVQLIRL